MYLDSPYLQAIPMQDMGLGFLNTQCDYDILFKNKHLSPKKTIRFITRFH